MSNLNSHALGTDSAEGVLTADPAEKTADSEQDIILRHKREFTIIAPKGNICTSEIKGLKECLYEEASQVGCKIILNFRFVRFIDSMGLGMLITAYKMADECGGMIVFTDMNKMIFKTMQMLNLDRVFTVSPDMKGAVGIMDW